VGVVGQLQLDVLLARMEGEYQVKAGFEPAPYETARWVICDDKAELQRFIAHHRSHMAEDHDGLPVFLARNQWELNYAQENWKKIGFLTTREQF
jgi:peptide chain release factor 3